MRGRPRRRCMAARDLVGAHPGLAGAPKGKWLDFLADPPPGFSLADAAYTTQAGRRAFEHRCAIAARDVDGLRDGASRGEEPCAPHHGHGIEQRPGVVLMFPGGGAHYPGAGRELLGQPAFQQAVDECLRACRPRRRPTCAPSCSTAATADIRGRGHPGPADLRHAGLVHARIRAGQIVGELGHRARGGHRPQRWATTWRPAWRA